MGFDSDYSFLVTRSSLICASMTMHWSAENEGFPSSSLMRLRAGSKLAGTLGRSSVTAVACSQPVGDGGADLDFAIKLHYVV